MEIFDQSFTLMAAGPFEKITAAISLVINCENQSEVDYYWNKLSADKAAEQCGWLRDKFGISWQIVPKQLGELLAGEDKEAVKRTQQAMLKMKKIVIKDLEAAYKKDYNS